MLIKIPSVFTALALDAIAVAAIVLFGFTAAEAVLPGFVSHKIPFSAILLVTAALLVFSAHTLHDNEHKDTAAARPSKTTQLLFSLFFLVILTAALYPYGILIGGVLALGSAVLVWLFSILFLTDTTH